MEKQKIFLNGMEFLAEPYSFYRSNSFSNLTSELKEGQFFYGSITYTGSTRADMLNLIIVGITSNNKATKVFLDYLKRDSYDNILFNTLDFHPNFEQLAGMYGWVFNGLKLTMLNNDGYFEFPLMYDNDYSSFDTEGDPIIN